MKKVLKITERDIMDVVNTLLEQESDDNYVRLTPQEVIQYYKDFEYEDFTKIRKFRNKKIIVTGKLDLRSMPITSLGGITKVEGDLDISYTKINNIDNVEVTGHTNDWGSGVYNKRIARERAQEKAVADGRRDDGDWDMTQNDHEYTILANALWSFLVRTDEVHELTEDDKEQIAQLEAELVELNKKYDESDSVEEGEEIYDKITEIEEKIEEIKEDKGDVYNLSPAGDYWGFKTFRVLGLDVSYNDEWSIATEITAEKAVIEYWENYIEDRKSTRLNSSH